MGGELLVTKTLRRRFFGVPGRLSRSMAPATLRLIEVLVTNDPGRTVVDSPCH